MANVYGVDSDIEFFQNLTCGVSKMKGGQIVRNCSWVGVWRARGNNVPGS